jgi:hypothetical protein
MKPIDLLFALSFVWLAFLVIAIPYLLYAPVDPLYTGPMGNGLLFRAAVIGAGVLTVGLVGATLFMR